MRSAGKEDMRKECSSMVNLVERIVFYGIDGRALLPLLVVLIYVVIGESKEIVREVKKIWQEVE